MMRSLLVATLAIAGGPAQNSDAKTYSGIRQATTDNVECKSLFGSGGTAPRSLPTVTASNLVLRTTTTEAPTTKPSYLTVNGPARTSTALTATSRIDYIVTVTSDVKVVRPNGPTATFATATFATTECTNGGAQTVTVYSGIYTPVPGQATALPASYPTQVVCQTTQNVLATSFHTVISGVATTTSFPVTTVSDQATTTVPFTFTLATQTTWKTTVTQTSTTLAAAATTQIIRTACAPHGDQDLRSQVRADEPRQQPRRAGPLVELPRQQRHEGGCATLQRRRVGVLPSLRRQRGLLGHGGEQPRALQPLLQPRCKLPPSVRVCGIYVSVAA
ncbi:hypothetical protein PG987_006102 [Apiospora arundinis]